MSTSKETNRTADEDVIELTPSMEAAFGFDDTDNGVESYSRIDIVASAGETRGTEITSLMQRRLYAVSILFLVVYVLEFIWSIINRTDDGFQTFRTRSAVDVLRLVVITGSLAVLKLRPNLSNFTLRGIEYGLFGFLTLAWIYVRYNYIVEGATHGAVADLLLAARGHMMVLLLLMIVHGLFIPHRWGGAARVAFTMALAPAVTIVLIDVLHPELEQRLASMGTLSYVSTDILIVLLGAMLATYGATVLSSMRDEVIDAKRYGQYQLLEMIGSGGMGQVHLVEHSLLKRPCAMKLIRPEASDDPTALARFEREVRTTAALTHPNTVAIYDYGHTNDGTFFYTMEYLPGMSIDELVHNYGPIPAGRVIYLLRQACSALADAHDAGLIHRDLKPANVFVSERGGLCDFVKVLDFGLVKLTKDPAAAQLTADHVVSGTPLYMSPEQAIGERGLDGSSDIYSLGAIAYFMLTGRPPFIGDSPVAIMIAHASQQAEAPSHHRDEVTAALEAIVLKCLQKKPADRFDNMLEFRDTLDMCPAASEWDEKKAALWWHDLTAHVVATSREAYLAPTIIESETAT